MTKPSHPHSAAGNCAQRCSASTPAKKAMTATPILHRADKLGIMDHRAEDMAGSYCAKKDYQTIPPRSPQDPKTQTSAVFRRPPPRSLPMASQSPVGVWRDVGRPVLGLHTHYVSNGAVGGAGHTVKRQHPHFGRPGLAYQPRHHAAGVLFRLQDRRVDTRRANACRVVRDFDGVDDARAHADLAAVPAGLVDTCDGECGIRKCDRAAFVAAACGEVSQEKAGEKIRRQEFLIYRRITLREGT